MLIIGTTHITPQNYTEHHGNTPNSLYNVNSPLMRFGTTPDLFLLNKFRGGGGSLSYNGPAKRNTLCSDENHIEQMTSQLSELLMASYPYDNISAA